MVFFDAPRCILCFRCVRICNEGMGVGALGVINRGVVSEIAPNMGDHLECDECGACIDICPVGALTSGIYRYQTRPWEMKHVGTICTHCADGCKTTLGVRNDHIIRGNNRDRSGINGEFLCIKGRYGFDFYDHAERLQAPLVRVNGKLEEVSWSQALETVAQKFNETHGRGGSFGVIGSNHTTNEENYYLQKFAREVLGTNNIDHHRTGDVVTLLDALSGKTGKLATVADLYERKAVLVLGADLALEHPLLSFQIRANYRHHQAHVYVVTPGPVREDKYAAASVRAGRAASLPPSESLREKLQGRAGAGDRVRRFHQGRRMSASWWSSANRSAFRCKYVCLVDYSNSRGAVDMGLMPELLPGLSAIRPAGMHVDEMLAADLDVLWVVGANPLEERRGAGKRRLPGGAGYVPDRNRAAGRRGAARGLRLRKERHRHQRHRRSAAPASAPSTPWAPSRIWKSWASSRAKWARRPRSGPGLRTRFSKRSARTFAATMFRLPVLATGGAAQTMPVNGRIPVEMPARPGAFGSQRSVRVRHAGALF